MMAHWAEIDENNIVLRVTVGSNEEPDEGYSWLINNLGGRWIKTSYNADNNGFRGKFAGIGDYYDEELDIFRVKYEDKVGEISQFGFSYDFGRGSFVPEVEDYDLLNVVSKLQENGQIDGLFIDVGAGIGNSSVLLSGLCNDQIYAVEPNTASYYWIDKNAKKNEVYNISSFNCFLRNFGNFNFSLLFSNNYSSDEIDPMEKEISDYANLNGIQGSLICIRCNFGFHEGLRREYASWNLVEQIGNFFILEKS